MLRLLTCIASVLLGLGASSSSAQAQALCLHPLTRAEEPTVLAPGFRRTDSHDYEPQAPGGGCSIHFEHASGLWMDVYIFRANLGEIEDRPRDPRLMELFQDGMRAIVHRWQTLDKGTVRELQARYAARGPGNVEIMMASAFLETVDAQRTLRSHLMLWSGGGAIWKVRATFPANADGMSDEAVMQMADVLVGWSRERP